MPAARISVTWMSLTMRLVGLGIFIDFGGNNVMTENQRRLARLTLVQEQSTFIQRPPVIAVQSQWLQQHTHHAALARPDLTVTFYTATPMIPPL